MRSLPRAAPSRRCSAAPWPASRAARAAAGGESGAVTPAVRAATRNVTAWPRTTTADASTIAGSAFRRSNPARMSAATAFRTRVHRERPPVTRARPTRTTASDDRGQRDRHERHERAHGRRQHQEDGDRQHGLHDLPGGALPDDGAQAAADVVHLAPVADAAMDVAGDAAREREVEEHRPVVGGDGGRQRQGDAEAAGDDRPPPRTADGGEEADGRRGQQERGRRPRARRRGTGRRRDARSTAASVTTAATAGRAHRRTLLTAAPTGRRGRR